MVHKGLQDIQVATCWREAHLIYGPTPQATHHISKYKLKQLSWRQQNTPSLVKYIWQSIELCPAALHLPAGAKFHLVSIYWNPLIPIRPMCSGTWLRSVCQSQIFCVIFTNAKTASTSPRFTATLRNSLHSLPILHNHWKNRQPKKPEEIIPVTNVCVCYDKHWKHNTPLGAISHSIVPPLICINRESSEIRKYVSRDLYFRLFMNESRKQLFSASDLLLNFIETIDSLFHICVVKS